MSRTGPSTKLVITDSYPVFLCFLRPELFNPPHSRTTTAGGTHGAVPLGMKVALCFAHPERAKVPSSAIRLLNLSRCERLWGRVHVLLRLLLLLTGPPSGLRSRMTICPGGGAGGGWKSTTMERGRGREGGDRRGFTPSDLKKGENEDEGASHCCFL